jgi:hypothetical protein
MAGQSPRPTNLDQRRYWKRPLPTAKAISAFIWIACFGMQAATAGGQDDIPSDITAQNTDVLSCNGSGTPNIKPGFLTRRNIIGSGDKDILLDYNNFTCSGVERYCGSGGCLVQIFVPGSRGGFKKIWEGLVRGVSFGREYGVPSMTIFLDGNACGLDGVQTCSETLYWSGKEFTPAHCVSKCWRPPSHSP